MYIRRAERVCIPEGRFNSPKTNAMAIPVDDQLAISGLVLNKLICIYFHLVPVHSKLYRFVPYSL